MSSPHPFLPALPPVLLFPIPLQEFFLNPHFSTGKNKVYLQT